MLIALVVAVVAVGLTTGTAVAQEGESPDVTVTSGTVEIDAGETSTVTATYDFEVAAVGSGDQRLSGVTGTVWKLGGNSVDGFAATVDGQEVDVDVAESDRHYEVTVPLADVAAGDTVTVTVTYEVAGTGTDARVPVWAPEYPTTGEDAVVGLQVTIPDGQQFQGDTFPRMDSVDGTVATAELLHVPGFVAVSYGSGGALGLNTILSTVGVLIVVGVLVGWVVAQRRRAQLPGGEPDAG